MAVGTVLVFGALAAGAMPAVTLDEALARGWRANPNIDRARANFERAEALVIQSRAAWLPTLSANGAFTQLDSDRAIADRVTTNASTLNASLVVQAPLLAVPRWLATGQAADARDIAKLDVAAFQRTIASLVGRAWIQVRQQQRVVEVATRALDVSTSELELARARDTGGIGTRLETARSERERADNESRLAIARADLAIARDTLGALIGEHGPVDIAGDPELPPIPANPVLDRRPDLRAANARVALAQRRADETWTEYLPAISASAGPIAQTPAYAPAPELGFQAQVVLTQPIFDGTLRYGLSEERTALLHSAIAERDALQLEAEQQLRSALAQLEQRKIATEAAKRSATLAEDAFRYAREAHAAGVGTSLELIEAERAARDAGTNASVVEGAAQIAQLDVLVAIGALMPAEDAR